MRLDDILADNVPAGLLKKAILKHDIDSKKNSAEVMARALASKNVKVAQSLAEQFRYAGATAINLNIAVSGIDSKWSNLSYVKNKLEERYGKGLFSDGLHPFPELNKEPQVIAAIDQGHRIVMAIAYKGTPYREWEGHKIVKKNPQVVEYAIIHFPFAIETRTNPTRNEKFIRAILSFLEHPDSTKVKWHKPTSKITNTEAKELAKSLGANLKIAKHKMTEGDYGTMEVTANPNVDDLESSERYQKELSNQPMQSKAHLFEYEYSDGSKQNVSYAINDKGIFIKTIVGEEVIEHVVDKLKQIRYPDEIEEDLIEEVDEDIEEVI